MKRLIFIILFLSSLVDAQQTTYSLLKVGDNGQIAPSAILEVKSTTNGVLLPRMTTTQKNAISSPATSLLVFDTTLNAYSNWNGSAWVSIGGNPMTGNLTEATSNVLSITGGTGAVIGSGTSIQVLQATSTQNGYLSSTDWSTFNTKAGSSLGNLTSTDINQNLIPNGNFTLNLGSSSANWNTLFVNDIQAASNAPVTTPFGLDLDNQKISSLATPTNSNDATTKQYVDTNAANVDLSNLSSGNVALNASIIPATNNSMSLGGLTRQFSGVYSVDFFGGSGSQKIDMTNQIIHSSSGTNSIDFGNRKLEDTSSFVSVDWGARQLTQGSTDLIDWSGSTTQVLSPDNTASVEVSNTGVTVNAIDSGATFQTTVDTNINLSSTAVGSTIFLGFDQSNINLSNNNAQIEGDGTGTPFSFTFLDGSNNNSVTISASSAVSSTYSLFLPISQGASNSVLSNNGSGNLFWSLPANTTQTLTAGGTISSSAFSNAIQSSGAVSTSTSTVIAAGTYQGQTLIIVNVGSSTITMKAGGNTDTPGLTDYPLASKGSISEVWMGSVWYTTGASIN